MMILLYFVQYLNYYYFTISFLVPGYIAVAGNPDQFHVGSSCPSTKTVQLNVKYNKI